MSSMHYKLYIFLKNLDMSYILVISFVQKFSSPYLKNDFFKHFINERFKLGIAFLDKVTNNKKIHKIPSCYLKKIHDEMCHPNNICL